MKVVYKAIDMIAWFEKDGKIHPIKFRLKESEEDKIISIDKIRCVKTEKFGGNLMYVFECESVINSTLKIFEIKYEVNTCKWVLFKI
ncbi:hypothetical protein [Helicovermis profundi]|uniref:Uncharacterized protein n=1 Tax=Helicovermis profundi TaxID=3065157 RepID=A0AAU9E3S0_9FIRM|nr:hypothetical protein HLPR_16120 [Clostridia bacterium S502]